MFDPVAGLALAAFEFYAAGAGVAAAVAALSLFLAGYGMATLPINWLAIAATVVGLVLYTWDFQRNELGLRSIAGTALGYYGSVTVLNALIYAVTMNRLRPGLVRRAITHHWPQSLASGGASFSAYALVVWAFTREPIALVASLRETSILFSLLLGVVFLNERLSLVKTLAIVSTMTGVVLLRLGG